VFTVKAKTQPFKTFRNEKIILSKIALNDLLPALQMAIDVGLADEKNQFCTSSIRMLKFTIPMVLIL
jgi:hypothetical protein